MVKPKNSKHYNLIKEWQESFKKESDELALKERQDANRYFPDTQRVLVEQNRVIVIQNYLMIRQNNLILDHLAGVVE